MQCTGARPSTGTMAKADSTSNGELYTQGLGLHTGCAVPQMQAYAARSVVDVMRRGAGHESLLCTAAYVLGEYGKLVQVGWLMGWAWLPAGRYCSDTRCDCDASYFQPLQQSWVWW
jgi:hypothetical protein